jgi:hypothetical protein
MIFPIQQFLQFLKRHGMQGKKTAGKSLASYVELHVCGRILIISASFSTVIGLLMSARLYVLDIPFNNYLTINESVLSVILFIFILKPIAAI